MSRSDLVRGVSGVLLASFWIGTACSSSDAAPANPEGEAGAGTAHGGASAGAPAVAGKGGKSSGISGSGGRGGAGTSGDAGAATAGDAGAATGGHAGHGGHAEPAAGGGMSAGAGPEAGSGGAPEISCSPSDDQCPAGKYCSSANLCVDGCKTGSSCASGVCDANHDCQNCISDLECAGPRLCGASQCGSACSAEQEGGSLGCGAGLTCCSLHCVSTLHDSQHCGACGTACSSSQFCGQSGCAALQLSSLCQVGKLVVILDGQYGDDPTGRALAQSLVDHCASSQTVREVSQTVADALNPVNGRPVSGSDELLLIAGSSYFQQGAGYYVTNKFAPLTNLGTQNSFEIRDSSTGALIASELMSETSDSNDLFAVQFMREPSSGSLALNAYGFTVGGTAAATFYFEHVIAANFAGATKAWYVGKWKDENENQQPDESEFTMIAAGD